MNKILFILKLISLSLILSLVSCENTLNPGFKQEDYEPIVKPDPVRTLNSYASGERVILSNTAQDLVLSWTPTTEHGNTIYRYEVLFDKTESDFSNPVLVLRSNNNGINNELTISHYQLNSLGRQLGYKSNQEGSIHWKIKAYCGLDESISSLEGFFSIMMMDGLDNIPEKNDKVYITGNASEDNGNENIAQCLTFMQADVYQVFTYLKANQPFVFGAEINNQKYYYYAPKDGKLRDVINEDYCQVDEDGIYRITVKFEDRTISYDKVEEVYLFCNSGNVKSTFDYLGYGKWGVKNYTATKRKEDWASGGETRHSFRMILNIDNNRENIIWGHKNKDDNSHNFSSDDYFNLYIAPTTDPWDYCFRYNGDLLKWGSEQDRVWTATVKTDITLYFNNDYKVYTHRWVKSE